MVDIHCTDGESEPHGRGTFWSKALKPSCCGAVWAPLSVGEGCVWGGEQPLQGSCGRVFGRWVRRGVEDEACWGGAPRAPPLPTTHTVVMTFREPDLKRRIFFFSACDALIFTKTLAGPAGVATPAAPPGPDGEPPAAAAATSC